MIVGVDFCCFLFAFVLRNISCERMCVFGRGGLVCVGVDESLVILSTYK